MKRLRYPAISLGFLSAMLAFSLSCSKRPSDDVVAQDIQKKVASDPGTRDSSVTVAAKDGKVTLKGTVSTPAARERVEQIAHEEPGTVDVDNETSVQQAEATPPPAPAPNVAPPVPANPPPAPAEQKPVIEEKPKPKPQPVVVAAGTVLTVTTTGALSSGNSQAGQTFLASLAQPISSRGRLALATGSTVSGTVVAAKKKGKIKGQGELSLALSSISVGGHTYQIQTSTWDSDVKGKGKRTAVATGGGAAGGAIIGGLAGGGKGAGIGAAVGAGAGFIGGALTGNKQIELPPESVLSFTLTAPLTLPPG